MSIGKKRTRNDSVPPKPLEVPDHYELPEIAEHVQAIDDMMSIWPLHKDQFVAELLQYKDIERAFEHLDALQDTLDNVVAIVTRTGKKGKPGGGQIEDWRSNHSFIVSRQTLTRQAKEIKIARRGLEFKTLISILKRCERSIGTLRNNLAVAMEKGLTKSVSELIPDTDVEMVDKVEVEQAVISDEEVGGEVYREVEEDDYEVIAPPDEQLEFPQGADKPYYIVVSDWEEDLSLVTQGRATAAIDLRKFPSLMEGGGTEIGVDIARYGEDRTVVTVVQGNHMVDQVSYPQFDVMETCGVIVQTVEKWSPVSVLKIETTGGLGAGVYDRMRELGLGENMRILQIEVQGKPTPRGERLNAFNLRAELYLNLEERMRIGTFTLLPDKELAKEIAHIRYKISSNGKIQILDKNEIKKNLERSPDKADSTAIAAWIAPAPMLYI